MPKEVDWENLFRTREYCENCGEDITFDEYCSECGEDITFDEYCEDCGEE